MRRTTIARLAAAALLAAGVLPARAIDFAPDGVSADLGVAKHGARMAGVGLVWDWDFERMRKKAELTAHTEVMLNHWRADAVGGGHVNLNQVVVLPSLRMRLARGASPVFIEIGIGASWLDRDFESAQKRFSTRWNFFDMLGIGYSLDGVDGKHEVGLRWTHTSNAGIRKPNPGQDFLQLHYVLRF
jgi:lipid A 3-O-deacylase